MCVVCGVFGGFPRMLCVVGFCVGCAFERYLCSVLPSVLCGGHVLFTLLCLDVAVFGLKTGCVGDVVACGVWLVWYVDEYACVVWCAVCCDVVCGVCFRWWCWVQCGNGHYCVVFLVGSWGACWVA